MTEIILTYAPTVTLAQRTAEVNALQTQFPAANIVTQDLGGNAIHPRKTKPTYYPQP